MSPAQPAATEQEQLNQVVRAVIMQWRRPGSLSRTVSQSVIEALESALEAAAARPADSPYVTTRLAEAADRAAKAEARAEKAEAHLSEGDRELWEALKRAEKAEADYKSLREYIAGHIRDRKKAEAHVAELTTRAEKAEHLLEMEQGSREAWRKEAAEAKIAELTHKLNEARNVLREVEWRDGYCSSCRQRWSQFNIENKHKPGCRLAAVIAPETGKETL